MEIVRRIVTLGYGIVWHDDYRIARDYDAAYSKIIGELFGTMNSVRKGALVNGSEFTHELFAQYINTGAIKLKTELPSDLGSGEILTTDPEKLRQVNKIIKLAPTIIERWFDKMMAEQVGDIICV